MESIDRLREYGAQFNNSHDAWSGIGCEILEHADAIEREVEDELKAKDGQMWLRGYGECHAELMEGNEVIAADLEKAGWVKLPVDAEGEPIHVGDVMEWPDCSTAEVVGVGDGTFFYVEDGEDAAEWSCASDKIHHRAPTVEDVLAEFAAKLIERGELTNGAAQTIAEYAAKLRLAGDE